jgi:CheY-like chemotaxis protein
MKILLVEDEPDLRVLLTRFLEREHYTVSTATNGLEGFEIIKTWTPDLVISDIQMPLGNGYTLLRHMQALPAPPIPVIFISGYAREEALELANAPNLKGFLAKPFKPKELLTLISSILKSSSTPISV